MPTDLRNITPADRLPDRKLVKSQQLNQLIDRINRSMPLMHVGQVDDVPTPPPTGLWAKVAGDDGAAGAGSGDGTYFHAWTEQSATAAGAWVDASGGLSGTTSDKPLISADGSQIPADTVVWAVPETAEDGSTQYRAEPAVGIDLEIAGSTVVPLATSIDIPAATSGVLGFGGSDGNGILSLATPAAGGTYKGIFWNGTAWVLDWVRAHS